MEDIKVKVCGNTRIEDVRAADEAGANFVGVVVEVASSPRSVSADVARDLLHAARRAIRAMLTLNPSSERMRELVEFLNPDVVHLTGEESPSVLGDLRNYFKGQIFKSIHLPPAGQKTPPIEKAKELIQKYADAGADAVVVDTRDASRGLFGGTGRVSDWDAAAAIAAASPLPVFLAGGINISNVEEAIKVVQPYGVDLASGLECAIGQKDHQLIRTFIDKVKTASKNRQP